MRGRKHSGFNVDHSVRIEAGDHAGMQRLVEYISRCPFSLARMVTLNADGRIVNRTSKGKCFPFPQTGDPVLPERCTPPIQTLMAGIPRNFEVFDPLDFLAEVTQHIPNKGEHQIRYYGKEGCPAWTIRAGHAFQAEMPHDVGRAYQVRLRGGPAEMSQVRR
jgi:hypothetical protein